MICPLLASSPTCGRVTLRAQCVSVFTDNFTGTASPVLRGRGPGGWGQTRQQLQGWRIWHLLLCLLGILALSACGRLAPANVPPQLDHTPGPPVVIADGVYRSVAFSLRVPPGWQIVTSPASSPTWAVFINPEEDAVIVVAVDEQDTLNVQPPQVEGERVRRVEAIELSDGSTVYAVLVAGAAVVDDYGEVYRRVVESINAA